MSKPEELPPIEPPAEGGIQEVRLLFEELVDLSAGEREAVLARIGRSRPEIARQVESLLLSAEDAEAAVGGALAGALDAVSSDRRVAAELAPGARLGPYRIERELGRGGMGIVLLASRDDREYRSQVAIKVLRSALDSDELETRFRTERQILADLDHPNIARLIDGGSTDSGLPYLVMERVEGLPITEYCDRQRLSTEARVRLFLGVCSAVRFAHRSLVVHRDLKPSNILVTEGGRPKLLDFGIAKLLAPGRVEHSVAETVAGTRLLSPGYASPEQILGEAVTTSSDVYSLGVLLYELLSGSLPYPDEESLPAAMKRVLDDTAPRRPSTVVELASGDPATTERVASARASEPKALRHRLEGDLDHIVLMALRREPERRYRSVDDLADDLERHLDGRPVAARPSTVGYRLRKLAGRHREAVAIAVSLALVLLSMATFYTLRLRQERSEARREAAKARQVSEFLVDLFQISDPSRSRGETITARELLDRGSLRIRELEGEPDVQAAMMDAIGSVYRTLALYDEAEPLLEGALERRRALAGDRPSADVAHSLQSLGRLRASQGDAVAAESLQRQALARWQQLPKGQEAGLADSWNDLGVALYDRGEYAAAEKAHRTALEIGRQLYEESDPELAPTLDRLAAALHDQGRYDEAEAVYREALELRREAYGEESLEVADSYSNLGNLLRFVDRPEEALEAHRRGLEIRRKVLGPHHPDLTTSLNGLAVQLAALDRVEEAVPLFREAYEIRLESLGPDHPRVGVPLTGLADAMRRLGRLDEAEELYRESVDLHRRSLPEGHPFISHPIAGLAMTLSAEGDHAAAATLFREALDLRRAALEPTHWRIPYTESQLGAELVELGRAEEGFELLERGRDTLASLLGEENTRTVDAAERLRVARRARDGAGAGGGEGDP